MSHRSISRRTVLRGMGSALALPLLDAMLPSGIVRAAAGQSAAPTRMAFCFVPNGVNLPKWTPNRVGYDYDLPYILEPLRRVKDDVNVLSGLTHDKGRSNGDGPGDHARSASVFLTGAQPRKTAGTNIRSGVSVDQVAAQQHGHLTKLPSLELGCETARRVGNCDSGYACAYSHNISWSSPSTPVAKETNPRLVFERLFSADQFAAKRLRNERLSLKKSLLDYVSDDARRLQLGLGRTDRHKLDDYLSAVRQIEQRIQQTEAGPMQTLSTPGAYPQPAGIPEDFGEHIRLMCDMIVLAFQADLTRIATFMFGRAGSNLSYRQIGVPDGHHNLSHHGGNPEKLNKIAKINRYHVEQFVYLLERLRSIPEGDGTLLDQCMIVYGSGLSDGNRHNNENLPVLLAGQGNGSIHTGRHIVYDQETPMTNLFLSLLDRFGTSVDWLGDSTGSLQDLSV